MFLTHQPIGPFQGLLVLSWVWLFKISPFLTVLRGSELFHRLPMPSRLVPFKNIMLHVVVRKLPIVDSVLSPFLYFSVSVIMCVMCTFFLFSSLSGVFCVWHYFVLPILETSLKTQPIRPSFPRRIEKLKKTPS